MRTKLAAAAVLCILLTGSNALAVAPPKVKIAAASVVPCQQGSHLGSCTYIGSDLFVGCNHVAEKDAKVYCGGRECVVVARNEKYDIVVMKAAKAVRGLPAASVASKDVQGGDVVFGVGYGVSYSDEDGLKTVKRRVFAGVVRGTLSPDGVSLNDWYYFSSVKGARSGDSGGAVFNINGELVASLWGRSANGRLTYATDNSILLELLKEAR